MRHKPSLLNHLIATALFISLSLAGAGSGVARAAESDGGHSRQKLIAELKSSGVKVGIDRRRGVARFVGANRYAPVQVSGVSPGAAASFNAMVIAEKYGNLFGLSNPREELVVHRDGRNGSGGGKIHYQQRFKGVPVMGGELIVNMDRGGALLSMNGETGVVPKNLAVTPVVDRSKAVATALAAVAKWYHLPLSVLKASAPELTIYDAHLLGPGSSEPLRLGWRVEVRPLKLAPIRELVLVDAKSGGIALHFNQVDTAKSRQTYSANSTGNLPGTLLCSADDPCTSGVGANAEANFAHLYAGTTYDFYLNYHGRDSLDDAGATMISTVDFDDGFCPNAYWDGTQMVYCQGFPEADDVVGHELTHAVTEQTSNLMYYYQSGAISESFSDLWGEFVDLTNGYGNDTPAVRWKIGEDLAITDMPGAIRDMKYPVSYQQPDKMSSSWYYAGPEDSGGVHVNSGINNKAVYLLTDGATFNGQTVVGLGIAKVAKIYYEAQTHLLTSGADYLDLDSALNQACANLIGGTAGITANDCLQVRAATTAVEMGNEPAADFSPEAQVCPTGQSGLDVFFDDFESGFSRWSLTSLPSGNQNWGGYQAATDFHLYGNSYATSGVESLLGADISVLGDQLATITLSVPTGQPYLHFRHAFDFEQSGANYYDGGILQYSTDNGTNWNDAMTLYESGKNYNGAIYSGSDGDNPLKGKSAFVGVSNGYVSTRLDLATLAGRNVKFRWRVGTDTGTGYLGWVLDDVRVYTCGGVNSPPVVSAGTPQTVFKGTSVTLNGNASSDSDGTIAGYAWEMTGGTPAVTLVNANTATPSFTAPSVVTTLTFRLTVTDNQGATASATTTVKVVNTAPVAATGPAQTVDTGAAVTLNGTASSDSDGTIVSCAWTQTEGTSVTLNNSNTATPSFTAPAVAATLAFRLTVTDNDGATNTVTTTVTVKEPPVAAPAAGGGGGGCSLSRDGGCDPLLVLIFMGAAVVMIRRRRDIRK